MNNTDAVNLVLQVVNHIVDGEGEINKDTSLLGNGSILDSMMLVEVCLALEDIADENGFEFDWTTETAMSKSRSMFRSISALAEEFAKQSEV